MRGDSKYEKSAMSEFQTSICMNLEDLAIAGQIPKGELPKFHLAEAIAFAQSV